MCVVCRHSISQKLKGDMSNHNQNIGVCDVIQFVDNAWGEKFKIAQISGENMDTCKINLKSIPPTLNFMNTEFVGRIIVDTSSSISSMSSSSSNNNNNKKRSKRNNNKNSTDYLSTVILVEKSHEKIQIIGQTNRIIEFDELKQTIIGVHNFVYKLFINNVLNIKIWN